MEYKPEELSTRLRAEGEAVQAFFCGLPAAAWDQEVYSENQRWLIRDLLAHFIAAEKGFQQLIENVRAGGSGVGLDFDVDEYNQRTVAELGGLEPGILIGQYAMVRERTAALVGGLSPEQLAYIGRHPAAGTLTLSAMVRIIYHHNNQHLRDIRRVLKASVAGEGKDESSSRL